MNSKFDYTYDARGRRVTMATLDGTWTYGYDGSGQLIRAVFASLDTAVIPNQDLQYFYDAAGNRTQTVLNGVTTLYTTNNLNLYTTVGGVTQSYDADGNLTFDGVNTYVYDQQSRPVRVTGPQGMTEYEYDAFGNRAAKVENGVRTEHISDPFGVSGPVAEYHALGSLAVRYYTGLGLVGRASSPASAIFYEFESLGSVVGATDESSASVARYAYDPTGRQLVGTSSFSNPFRFSGQTGVVAESGNSYLSQARRYDAGTGRFTTPDPMRINGGETVLYTYAGNNPVGFIDPAGLSLVTSIIDGLASGMKYYDKYDTAEDIWGLVKNGWASARGDYAKFAETGFSFIYGTGGEVVGGNYGALLGSRIGLLFGPAGAIPGAAIGWVVGSVAGSEVGDYLGGKLGELIWGKPPTNRQVVIPAYPAAGPGRGVPTPPTMPSAGPGRTSTRSVGR